METNLSARELKLLLDGLADRSDNKENPRPHDDAIVMELQRMQQDYCAPNPFQAGDLVTIVKGRNRVSAGEPAIVIEVLENPLIATDLGGELGSVGTPQFGETYTTRIALHSKGEYIRFWEHHCDLEPWKGE